MAPDRRVAGVVDRPGAQLHLRPSEQILDQEQLPVPQHRIERRHAGVGPEHEDAVEAGLLSQLAGVDLERLTGTRPAQITAIASVADQRLIAARAPRMPRLFLHQEPADSELPMAFLFYPPRGTTVELTLTGAEIDNTVLELALLSN